MFLCNPQKSGVSRVCIAFLQITQKKILTKDIFHWLQLITEILSFLQIFSIKKNNPSAFVIFQKLQIIPKYQQKDSISGKFWDFNSKLQIVHGATYASLFLPDSNNCFFICLVPYIPICLYYFLILFFYFHLLFHSLLTTRHILQFTMFDLISLQPARNISEIRHTSQSTTKKNCRVNQKPIQCSNIFVNICMSFSLILIKLLSFLFYFFVWALKPAHRGKCRGHIFNTTTHTIY